jgi:hypothetical protein
VCLAPAAQAQDLALDWAFSFGVPDIADNVAEVLTDDNGNIYVLGRYAGTVDFSPGAGNVSLTSNGIDDIFVAKYDTDGNLIWVKSLGGPDLENGSGLGLDANGNIFVCGNFYTSLDADPGTGVYDLTVVGGIGGPDIFVLKLDPNGDLVWAHSIGSTVYDSGHELAIASDGSVLVAGLFSGTLNADPTGGTDIYSTNGGADAYLLKLDNDGNYQWFKQIGGTGDEMCRTVAMNSLDQVIWGGYFVDVVDLDPSAGGIQNETASGTTDGFFCVLASDGSFVVASALGGAGTTEVLDMAIDNSDNVLISGSFTGDMDIAPYATTDIRTSAGQKDVFAIRLDAGFNLDWGLTLGGTGSETCNAGMPEGASHIYLVGEFFGTMDMAPGATDDLFTSAGQGDLFIIKLDTDGNYWAGHRVGGTEDEAAYTACTTDAGDLIIGATVKGPFDADFWFGQSLVGPAANAEVDAAVIKYKYCAQPYISGTVNVNAAPCDQCTVYAYAYPGAPGAVWPKLDSTYTDASGNYFMYLHPGADLVMQAVPLAGTDAVPTYSGNVHLWSTAQHQITDCGTSHQSDIDMVTYTPMAGTCTISGKVNQLWQGKTLEEDPIPLIDVVIERTPPGNVTDRVVTDINGNFEFDLVEADNSPYLVRVMIPGLPVQNGFMVQVDPGDVAITDLFYCVDIDTSVISPCSGIGYNELSAPVGHFTLSPNPSSGPIMLHGATDAPTALAVLDVTGRQVHAMELPATPTGHLPIDLGHLPVGVYTLRLSTSAGSESIRLVRL